jgi:hypothetical protein
MDTHGFPHLRLRKTRYYFYSLWVEAGVISIWDMDWDRGYHIFEVPYDDINTAGLYRGSSMGRTFGFGMNEFN